MRKPRGFTLTELVIVVALVGILAAVVIPLLQRAMIAANEAETLGDIRTIIDAQTGYSAVNGGFYDGNLGCLVFPAASDCIPNYPTSGPTFLDSQLAALTARSGYNRLFTAAVLTPVPPTSSPTSIRDYRYDATPMTIGITGVRGFAGQADGRICFTPNGTPVPLGPAPGTLPQNCTNVP